jgi:hypothetical protein
MGIFVWLVCFDRQPIFGASFFKPLTALRVAVVVYAIAFGIVVAQIVTVIDDVPV